MIKVQYITRPFPTFQFVARRKYNQKIWNITYIVTVNCLNNVFVTLYPLLPLCSSYWQLLGLLFFLYTLQFSSHFSFIYFLFWYCYWFTFLCSRKMFLHQIMRCSVPAFLFRYYLSCIFQVLLSFYYRFRSFCYNISNFPFTCSI